MNAFFDSSALAKRYVDEPGSDRVAEILRSASALGVSILAPAEIVSALCRRRRERVLNRTQYARAKQALFEDVADAQVVALTDPVIVRAIEVLERWPVRASDALHVACAAEWQCDLFVTSDERQMVAARGCGLAAEFVAPQ